MRVVDGGFAGGFDGWSSRGLGGEVGGVPGDTGGLRRDLIGGSTVEVSGGCTDGVTGG